MPQFAPAWKSAPPARVPYEAIRPTLQTGDIALFSGGGQFSALIKAVTGSKWSHAAMVYLERDAAGAYEVMLWESCGGGVKPCSFDAYFRPKAKGFHASAAWLNRHAGDCVIRRLVWPRTPAMFDRFEAFKAAHEGKPYETDLVELGLATLGEWGNATEALDSFFCSEIVAETWRALGLLPASRPGNSYRPRDFSDAGYLPIVDGAALEPEVLLAELAPP